MKEEGRRGGRGEGEEEQVEEEEGDISFKRAKISTNIICQVNGES